MVEPGSGFLALAAAIGGKDLLVKVFGPTAEYIGGELAEFTERRVKNVKAIIEAAGMALENVVKCSCFLKNMEDFVSFNAVYEGYFGESAPARETVEVARLPKDVLVEISAICGI